jgi:heat shock protein HslJ
VGKGNDSMTIAPEHRDSGGLRASGGPGSTGGSARAWRGKALWALLLLGTLAAVGGCGGSSGTAANEFPLRTDTKWQLESFQPKVGPIIPVSDPTLYTVRFGGGGRVEIRADCNQCSGTYQISGASLSIGPLACTLAACPLPSLGPKFTDALTRVSSYIQTQGELILVYDDGTLRLLAAQ